MEKDEDELPTVEFFKWTGRNDYVALCEPDSVSVGGGSVLTIQLGSFH